MNEESKPRHGGDFFVLLNEAECLRYSDISIPGLSFGRRGI